MQKKQLEQGLKMRESIEYWRNYSSSVWLELKFKMESGEMVLGRHNVPDHEGPCLACNASLNMSWMWRSSG